MIVELYTFEDGSSRVILAPESDAERRWVRARREHDHLPLAMPAWGRDIVVGAKITDYAYDHYAGTALVLDFDATGWRCPACGEYQGRTVDHLCGLELDCCWTAR